MPELDDIMENLVPLQKVPSKHLPNLYSISKLGKILVYKIRVESDIVTTQIISETGYLGGKLKPHVVTVHKGKNIGKSNQTTPQQQAILDATSSHRSKRVEGYKSIEDILNHYIPDNYKEEFQNEIKIKDISTIVSKWFKKLNIWHNTDHNNRFKVMLADKYRDYPYDFKKNLIAYIQAKLNGVRCSTETEDNKILQLSREGTLYNVQHIQESLDLLKDYLIENSFKLDGELYVHGMPLQDIGRLVDTPQTDSIKLEYVIYDIACTNPLLIRSNMKTRYNWLQELKLLLTHLDIVNIRVLDTYIVNNADEVFHYFNLHLKQGFEGSIIRNPSSCYMFSFRDRALLKLKETISAEFEIIGVICPESGITSDFNWECITPNGHKFGVKSHGTVEQRETFYKNSDKYIGKKLSLSFYEYTNDNIPFHITEVTVRDYE